MTNPQENAVSWRCRFEKRGPIRYISHLDLTRAFHRAFSRAQLPLKFSEGFSPHPKFAFALPLSVGMESVAEFADFTLKPGFEIDAESLMARLQEQMPTGIRLIGMTRSEGKFSDIAFASYTVTLPNMDARFIPDAQKALEGEILIRKKNKKGKTVEKEISSGIRSLTWESTTEGTRLSAVLSASGDNYLKPETILEVLGERLPEISVEEKLILRTGVFKSDLTPFS